MGEEIFVCEYEGYSIVLRMPEGIFCTIVEDTPVQSKSLADLQERLKALNVKISQKKRHGMKSVSVFLLLYIKGKRAAFELREVLGIVAGRTSSPTLRTMQGQEVMGTAIALMPGDRRIPVVQKLLQEQSDAENVFVRARDALQVYLKELPHIAVPAVTSKEDAVDKEPLFLDELRNIFLLR